MFLYTLILSLLLQGFTEPTKQIEEPINLSGYWAGTVTQNDGEYSSSFDIDLHLEDKDGKITGISILKANDIYAKILLEGTFESGLSLVLHDTEIQDNKVITTKEMEWCMKKYILLLKREKNGLLLEGHWFGKTSFNDCSPGKVYLKKGEDRV